MDSIEDKGSEVLVNLLIYSKLTKKFAVLIDLVFGDVSKNKSYNAFFYSACNWMNELIVKLSNEGIWDQCLSENRRTIKFVNVMETKVDIEDMLENFLANINWIVRKAKGKSMGLEFNADYWDEIEIFEDIPRPSKEVVKKLPKEERKKVMNEYEMKVKTRRKNICKALKHLVKYLIVLDIIYCDKRFKEYKFNALLSEFNMMLSLNSEMIKKYVEVFSSTNLNLYNQQELHDEDEIAGLLNIDTDIDLLIDN